ncbi:MAG: hypothetical protein R3D00_10310 [Bacteroidia bacterium]
MTSPKTIRYGIVGFSRDQFDKKAAYLILDKIFRRIKEAHQDQPIEIVSGYTNSGVPKIAYELADKYRFTTTGFSAKQALQVKSGVYPVNKCILVGEKFGDESVSFVRYIDALIRIGGGKQSRNEVELFRKMNVDKPIASCLEEYEIEGYGEKPEAPDDQLLKS